MALQVFILCASVSPIKECSQVDPEPQGSFCLPRQMHGLLFSPAPNNGSAAWRHSLIPAGPYVSLVRPALKRPPDSRWEEDGEGTTNSAPFSLACGVWWISLGFVFADSKWITQPLALARGV